MDEKFPQTELILAQMRNQRQANAISELRDRTLFLKIQVRKLAKVITRKHEWAVRLKQQLLDAGIEPVSEADR